MEKEINKEDFNKLVNNKGNIPILTLILKKENDCLIPNIVANTLALKNESIRLPVIKTLKEWIKEYEVS